MIVDNCGVLLTQNEIKKLKYKTKRFLTTCWFYGSREDPIISIDKDYNFSVIFLQSIAGGDTITFNYQLSTVNLRQHDKQGISARDKKSPQTKCLRALEHKDQEGY